MKNKEIDKKVEDTFMAIETIEKVKVSPYFEHKVLQKINEEKEEKEKVFSWLTPQFQLAAVLVILFLNAATIFYAFNSSEKTTNYSVETFSQEYSLESTSNSYLN
ncbi:hypothetical protein [Polaribacter marinaquae]|uniref:Anti-sigma factor n=1 Tax=Polaribacter marinaquae TaxID=1642819 RepID=A0ABZ2TTD5_9FLAO